MLVYNDIVEEIVILNACIQNVEYIVLLHEKAYLITQ